MSKVFIIAEAGVNHNGDVQLAKEMIEVAKRAGADAVKFQTFKAEAVISRIAPKAEYQKKTTGQSESQLDMVKKLELDLVSHQQLVDKCKELGIQFLSTPFDIGSVDILNELGVSAFKIPSGEITHLPYLRKIGSMGKEVILSTGMANLEEIKEALEILENAGTPREKICVLHCTTEYPAPIQSVNLLAMQTIRDELKVKVGYSDHTLGCEVAIAATALGAQVIEKHFTLDKNMEGPDHQASMDEAELTQMVKSIRNIEQALGDGRKRPVDSEEKNIAIVRKSIIALRDIQEGEAFTEENVTIKRPGTGISPMKWDDVIGQKARRQFLEDELIEL